MVNTRVLRTLVASAIGAVLLIVTIGTAGTVEASIPDRAFQAMGCSIGDYTCYYSRLGGSSYTYYCQNGYYTCTNGVPNTPVQNGPNVQGTIYCGDGGATGCVDGSALYTSTNPVDITGTRLAQSGTLTGHVLVTSSFVNVGATLPGHSDSP